MQSAAPTAAPPSASARSPACRVAAYTPPPTLQARIFWSEVQPTQHSRNAAYAAYALRRCGQGLAGPAHL